LVKTLGHTARTNGKPQIVGVDQGLAVLPTLQESINSRCLMTPSDCLVGRVVTGPHVASCRDDSFVHQAEATERVSTYCLVSEGPWSGSDSH
jgi:hypothetical protein